MEGPLEPVKTFMKVQGNIERFEILSLTGNKAQPQGGSSKISILEIVDSTEEPESLHIPSEVERSPLTEIQTREPVTASNHKRHKKHDSTAFLQQVYLLKSAPNTLPDDAREILKSQPDDQDLLAVLTYLQYGIEGQHEFSVRAINAKAAQIINVLITVTVPDHWGRFAAAEPSIEEKQMKSILLSCFTSPAGIAASLAQIKKTSILHTSPNSHLALHDSLSFLAQVLRPRDVLSTFLDDLVRQKEKSAQRQPLWQELCALLGGSKVLATVSQAISKVQDIEGNRLEGTWLGDGTKYSTWLAQRIVSATIRLNLHDSESLMMVVQLLKRGLNLGYRVHFVSQIYSSLLMGRKALWTPLNSLLQALSRVDQINFFDAMLRDLAKKYLSTSNTSNGVMSSGIEHQSCIGGVAAIVKGIISGNKVLEDYLVEWLTKTSGEHFSLGLDTRRAVIATLALKEGSWDPKIQRLADKPLDKLQVVLNKCLENFSDKIAVQHMPILQQDALAQTILLVVGCLNRLNSKLIKELSRSSLYLQSVSNRLAASAPRARILGMIVGVAVSNLVDNADKRMKFDIEEMNTEEVKGMIELITVQDQAGTLEALLPDSRVQRNVMVLEKPTPTPKPAYSRHSKAAPASKIIAIEELPSDSDDEKDLIPYRKPDDDASDSDDDPTLINRSKPTAPVYILDLIRYLQMSDKPDVVEMAVKTAPSLIRRKAGFGTELSENMNTLASALINLQDGMSKDEGHRLRLESMIACLVALPGSMGLWLASMYFEGDFSLAQRASLLTTIGLGTRELAGYKDDSKLTSAPHPFPSQRLPGHLDSFYAPMNFIAKQIEHATLQPLALAAADKVTGPDILKVRTFSSRMAVEKETAQKAKERQKKIPKDLHKLLAESFYLPLCCRMTLILSAHTNFRNTNLFEPHILKLFLQTLIILLTSLGPNALQLPTVTRETFNLLTTIHNITVLSLDSIILPPLLQLLLTCLQVNIEAGSIAEEHLVTDHGEMIAELVTWAGNISSNVSVPVGDGSDGMPWTIIAAGCQVKWHEVGQKFQGRMMGLVGSSFDDF